MKLLTYEVDSKARIGIMSRDEVWVYPLRSFGMDYNTMQEVVEGISESEIQLLEHESGKDPYVIQGAARLEEVKILAPIPHPLGGVICLGLNYMEHAEESARYKKEEFDGKRQNAVYFSKRVDRAVAPGEGIPSHSDIVSQLDYEVELAVIIGKEASHVAPEDVKKHVFGYTIINDVSARDIQHRHNQWFLGKSLDGFLPMGPCIVTVDSLPYPPKLQVQSIVNGELRQNSNTEQFIFDIDYVVSELSQGMVLRVGTVISMGTPSGVGMGFNPPKFLNIGDEVECRIEGIGSLKNTVAE